MNLKAALLMSVATTFLLLLAGHIEAGVTFHPPLKNKPEGPKKKPNPKRNTESVLDAVPEISTGGFFTKQDPKPDEQRGSGCQNSGAGILRSRLEELFEGFPADIMVESSIGGSLMSVATTFLLLLAGHIEAGVTFHPPLKNKPEGPKKKPNPKRNTESVLDAVPEISTGGFFTKQLRLQSIAFYRNQRHYHWPPRSLKVSRLTAGSQTGRAEGIRVSKFRSRDSAQQAGGTL
ncbi:UNVERIFIED_CONTAM: hypothetical protein FKN15_016053 [Acipenser sinensis]